jgi:superfamily II DNA or RNA helicase
MSLSYLEKKVGNSIKMPLPPEIIDNSEGNKLFEYLNESLKDIPQTNFDIATAFFNIRGFSLLKENLREVKKFRLLLGSEPENDNKKTLGEVLIEEVKKEVEGFDLTKENESTTQAFINFLNQNNVEVRLFDKFLHGKSYIFDDRIVVGSSNFTYSGLTRYGELNTWKQGSLAEKTKRDWFEKFWAESRDFKDELIKFLEDSRFGSAEYTPYQVYIKALYELQKQDLVEEEREKECGALPDSKVNLAQFQEDSVKRIKTRMKKYGGCIVADSVGLGKTWIAKKIIEDIGYYQRKNIVVVCPAQLREMWKRELKSIDVKENIISQEDLATDKFLEKAKKVTGDLTKVELIVVDESHNFRNQVSWRWENLFTLINDNICKGTNRPQMLFLTATPINNTAWDLYNQIMLIVLKDESAFVRENIPDLFKFFKEAQDKPAMLNDLLNEISIRRTRDYIIKNYDKPCLITPDGKEKEIIFPERVLENVEYKLDEAYQGMYKEISDIISNKLTMAYYRLLEYKKEEIKTTEESLVLGRMIAIGGIFRTILLKRLESSVEAFRISVNKHIQFLNRLIEYLKKGKLLTKQSFLKYITSFDEEIDESELKEVLDKIDLKQFNTDDLFKDINTDIKLLKQLLEKIKGIEPKDDAKLKTLKERLLHLSKDGQIVLFTYYADTLNYIYKDIRNDKRFSKLKIEAISSSGLTRKSSHQRPEIVDRFTNNEIDILLSTDVLSEGQNLQSAKYLINYDLHWNPTRMIQRAGRIDRIGSPYKKIFVYNFFPEDELEELLKLVQILQNKIIGIDEAVGLDQTILGEEIHPKVFGVIRKIKNKDNSVLDDLERDAFGGGEMFYQPLKEFLKNKAKEELDSLPLGIHSGLKKDKISGIFTYYKYGDDFHFWHLYDIDSNKFIKNKSEILDYISCGQNKKREMPDFFEKIYEINKLVVEDIKGIYGELAARGQQDSRMREFSGNRGTKFVQKMIREVDLEVAEFVSEFPNEVEIEKKWELVKTTLLETPLTKLRQQELRRMWKAYKSNLDWKKLIKELDEFLCDKGCFNRTILKEFEDKKLKLIVVDFIK